MPWFLLLLLLAFVQAPAALGKDRMIFDVAAFHFSLSESRAVGGGDNATTSRRTKTTHTFYGLGFCYVKNIWCLGARYMAGERRTEVKNSNQNQTARGTLEFAGYGLTLGYQGSHMLAHFTYYLEAEKRLGDTDALDFGASTNTKYPAKLAYSLDLGYGFDFRGIRVGPLLRIVHFEYDRIEVGSQRHSLPRTEADDFVIPHFAVWIDF